MPQISRPTKQGGATTYGGKVTAGYTTILASEMDADLDTIYSAWNTGVDGTNIQPGSITGDKLAPGAIGTRELANSGVATVDLADQAVTSAKLADNSVSSSKIIDGSIATADLADGAVTQAKLSGPITPSSVAGGDLSGSYPNPAIGTVQGGTIQFNPRGTTSVSATTFDSWGNNLSSVGFDNTKASWLYRLDYSADQAQILRAPPPGTAFAVPFYVKGSDGKTYCTLADGSVGRTQIAAGGVNGTPAFVANNQNFSLSTTGWATAATLNITTRGGCVYLWACAGFGVNAPSGGGKVWLRWLYDGSTQLIAAIRQINTTAFVPLSDLNWMHNPPPGAHSYVYQVAIDAGMVVNSSGVAGGGFIAQEIG